MAFNPRRHYSEKFSTLYFQVFSYSLCFWSVHTPLYTIYAYLFLRFSETSLHGRNCLTLVLLYLAIAITVHICVVIFSISSWQHSENYYSCREVGTFTTTE